MNVLISNFSFSMLFIYNLYKYVNDFKIQSLTCIGNTSLITMRIKPIKTLSYSNFINITKIITKKTVMFRFKYNFFLFNANFFL